ncbi:MAG TPA: TCR/Tet family MFS transporter [Opitutaceae bacterium]|nr:TCR/Tet family MFS transporter [Opitutaceae bacterium]
MSSRPAREPALRFIFVTLILTVLGFGIIIPVLPGLVTEFEGGSAAEGAHSFGWLVGSFALMQFIASPILGALSDRFGRRKVILLALGGAAIDYVLMGLAPTIGWLFVARIIAGLTAGALATCNAYIADVTPPEKRAQGFGLVGAAFGIGFVLGPVLGGVLGAVNLRLPFYAAAVCVGVNWLYGAFVLPESLPPEKRRAFSWKRANPVGALLNLRDFHGLGFFAAMHFLFMLGHTMLQTTWVLYTSYRYGWSPSQVGLSLMLAGIASAIVQGRLVGPLLRRIGERNGLILGLSLTVVVFTLYGLATEGWMIYPIIVVGGFAGITGPAAQSLITRRVPADEQGTVQGVLSGLASLAAVVATPIGAWSFAACISPSSRLHLPGVAFFEAALLCVAALVLAARASRTDAVVVPARV